LVTPDPGAVRADAARRLLRERLTSRVGHEGVAIGTFLIELPAPATIRALAMAGFSFVVIDMEHSTIDLPQAAALLSEARACGLPALVRVPDDRLSAIGNVLDAGANGVMIPHVDSVDAARAAVARARFAPLGERGFSPLTLFDALDEPQATMNRRQSLILQIEGRDGIPHAAEIGGMPGVDGVFVGPYDLAESLGTPSDIESEAVLEAASAIARSLPEERLAGIYMDDPRRSVGWAQRGFTFQCISFDGRMLLERARDIVRASSGEAAR
jgi:2-keto-3-deoxy-L-rhamnonate aldolase RhmA